MSAIFVAGMEPVLSGNANRSESITRKRFSLKVLAFTLVVGLVSTAARAEGHLDEGPQGGPDEGPTLVDVALAVNSDSPLVGVFDILIAELLVADPAVVATLDGRGQHTVFAPTDTAFETAPMLSEAEIIATIDAGRLDAATLTPILLYHVAKGRRDSEAVTTSMQIRMLDGGFVQVVSVNLTDNQGNVSTIIVPAANGIIHAINGALIP